MDATSWYRPVPVAVDLASHVATCWAVTTQRAHDLVPDACVDVVWFDNGRIWVCGPETTGWTFTVPGGTESVGLKFRPGRASAVLGFNAAELRNSQVRLEDILGARVERILADELSTADEPADRLRLMERRARDWLEAAREPDPYAEAIEHQLHRNIATPVSALATTHGLSARQLERRCNAAFGYGPATLRRILRLQQALRMSRHPLAPRSLARLAAQAGYADQQHLARDCRRIARTTPAELLRPGRTRGGVGSVQDLTG